MVDLGGQGDDSVDCWVLGGRNAGRVLNSQFLITGGLWTGGGPGVLSYFRPAGVVTHHPERVLVGRRSPDTVTSVPVGGLPVLGRGGAS